MMTRFQDRVQAGRLLAAKLKQYARQPDVLVLGLPRGGVPVAHEVARCLNVPMDIVGVRKLGVPGQPELAMGAIASDDVCVLNEDVIAEYGIDQADIDIVTARERVELARRERVYRGNRVPLDVNGKTVIIVDDGIATGTTMRAAVRALQRKDPAKLVVATPVVAKEANEEFRADPAIDACVYLLAPAIFQAVGLWYMHFPQTTDEEVQLALSGNPILTK